MKGGNNILYLKEKSYKLQEIISNDNLLFNLRLDIIFKKVFLRNNSINYLCLLISYIFKINYDSLIKESILINTEIPSKNIEIRSSNSDIVLRYRNIDFIIEMNYHIKNYTVEKNNSYLFNLHVSKIFNANSYGKNVYTYLLNIDDYDILNKDNLIYDANINNTKYNVCMYKNIKIKHLNLDLLRKKIYNNNEIYKLSDLEKILVIFICQRKDIINSITDNEIVKEVIKIMEKLKLDINLPTYDYEEFLRQERIGFKKEQKKLNKDKEELNKDKEELNKDKEELNKDKEELNIKKTNFNQEKENIVKEFKKLGLSIKRISEITKLPIDQIKMLL